MSMVILHRRRKARRIRRVRDSDDDDEDGSNNKKHDLRASVAPTPRFEQVSHDCNE